jgi:hypothetical protein
MIFANNPQHQIPCRTLEAFRGTAVSSRNRFLEGLDATPRIDADFVTAVNKRPFMHVATISSGADPSRHQKIAVDGGLAAQLVGRLILTDIP